MHSPLAFSALLIAAVVLLPNRSVAQDVRSTSEPTGAESAADSAAESTRDAHVTALEGRIRRLRALNDRYRRDESSLLDNLERHSRDLALAEAELELATTQQLGVEQQLVTAQRRAATLVTDVQTSKKRLRSAILAAYEQRVPSWLAVLLVARDPAELERNLAMIGHAGRRQSDLVKSFQKQLADLAEVQNELSRRRGELDAHRLRVTHGRAVTGEARQRTQISLDRLLARKGDAVTALRSASQELGGLIGNLGTQRRLPASTNFAQNRGQLMWPVNGAVRRGFGLERHPKLHTLIQHQGIEIAAAPGTVVLSVHDGEVAYADWFKRYGNLVIVDHGDGYYSLYAHLAEILTPVGRKVVAGSPLGVSGDTGPLGGPGVYFELRHGSQPVDPARWLERRSR